MKDEINGGISDRADDECDVYHTFFGIAGLSILGYPNLEQIDPVYALPVRVVDACLGRDKNSMPDALLREQKHYHV